MGPPPPRWRRRANEFRSSMRGSIRRSCAAIGTRLRRWCCRTRKWAWDRFASQEVAVLALRAKNDLILVKDGRTGKAVVILKFARTHQPELFAAKIKSGHHNLLNVQKGHINSLSIGGRGAGREAVLPALVLQVRGQHRLAPEDLSGGTIETDQDALLCFGDGSCRENPIIPDRKSTRLNSSHLGISYAVFC